MSICDIPFDVLCMIFTKLTCSLKELLELRLVCTTFLKVSEKSVVSKHWEEGNIAYLVYRYRACLNHQLEFVGCYDWSLFEGHFTDGLLMYSHDNTTCTKGALRWIVYGMEKAVLLALKGEQKLFCRQHVMLDRENGTKDSLYITFKNNDLMLSSDVPLYEDEDEESFVCSVEEEEEIEEDYEQEEPDSEDVFGEVFRIRMKCKYSSFNELHVRFLLLSFSPTLVKSEASARDFRLFFKDCKSAIRNQSHLLNERCCVTGRTCLLILWERLQEYDNENCYFGYVKDVVIPITRLCVTLGANVRIKDNAGRTICDWFDQSIPISIDVDKEVVSFERSDRSILHSMGLLADLLNEFGFARNENKSKRQKRQANEAGVYSMLGKQTQLFCDAAGVDYSPELESSVSNICIRAFEILIECSLSYTQHRRSLTMTHVDVMNGILSVFK